MPAHIMTKFKVFLTVAVVATILLIKQFWDASSIQSGLNGMHRYIAMPFPTTPTPHLEQKTVHVHYYNMPHWITVSVFNRCEYKCTMTYGSKGYDAAKVVMFQGPRIKSQEKPPEKKPGQLWIMHGLEPPAYYWNNLSHWANLFNWTFTYRRDSDVFQAPFRFHFLPNNVTISALIKERKTKDRISAWTLSHCGAVSKRDEYTKLMRKSTDIHVYGGCGQYKCPLSNENHCDELLRKHYKYYLAFENSLCVDYNSKRPFKTYRHSPSTIPVMRGGVNYSLFFPPGSYLDTADFDTADNLASFMNKPDDENWNLEETFAWTTRYSIDDQSQHKDWCSLCEQLHSAKKFQRLYVNIHNWLYDKPRKACKDAKDLL
ncbi:alpha-(1,3)-fucosyltransferase C-like [Pecten maximus]|uniref:alpha-(1,3)-fucosyltransferase C-like n=1 Tax=Pecten maximus TaxID=6579 RepID=UPI0014588F19|nr:alpha-(1,3)-fucosyltransferase C-like [Pecten maximus]